MIALPGRAQSRLGLVLRQPRDDGGEVVGGRRLAERARPADRVETGDDRVAVVGDSFALVAQAHAQVIPPRHTGELNGGQTGPA